MTIEKAIDTVFEDRNAAHLQHWVTRSHAEHVVLGKFYDAIVEVTDRLIEARQGVFGRVDKKPEDLLSRIQDSAVWLDKNREEISGGVEAIENILDELIGVYTSTAFLLTLK